MLQMFATYWYPLNMIRRDLENQIITHFQNQQNPQGLIVAGVVGCGKTTLIKICLDQLKKKYQIFEFSGDDSQFRNAVRENSKHLYQEVKGLSTDGVQPLLIFVDEVQKSDEIFDALKYAFDHGQISFIVSGSNPAYLLHQARKRLQRRANYLNLMPLAISEILRSQETEEVQDYFFQLTNEKSPKALPVCKGVHENKKRVQDFLIKGGLPLAHLAPTFNDSLLEIQKVYERGFEPILEQTGSLSDAVSLELARLHNREFTYQQILRKVGIRDRRPINGVIDLLKKHGYLLEIEPFLISDEKRSYLRKYGYIDPGLVSYLLGYKELQSEAGFRVEGLVNARLQFHLQKFIIKDKGLYFYKPFVNKNKKLAPVPGEIDLIWQTGDFWFPIEIKSTDRWENIDTRLLTEFVKSNKCPFGLVLYSGVPRRDHNIHYLPWWAC